MAQRLKEVDVVVIGVGMVGSIVAKELAAAGYKVVGLERGQPRFTVPEFQSPGIHDELRFDIRKALMQDNTREPVTFRNQGSQMALPVRRWESFLPGTGLGGSMVHWNGRRTVSRPTTFNWRPARANATARISSVRMSPFRTGGLLTMTWNRTTIASSTCWVPAARPATSKVRSSPAAIRMSRRDPASIRRPRRRSISRARCSARRRAAWAITPFRSPHRT